MSAPRHLAGATAPPAGPYDADIIILALDRAEATCAAIASALAQQCLARHVTVLDQGSAPAALAALVRAIDGRADATLLAAPCNLGVAGGRNAASAFGHGAMIAALDNDAVFDAPDTLARARAAFDAAPDVAVIGLRILDAAGTRDDPGAWGHPRARLPDAGGVFDAATYVGAGHAIRRAAWDDAGPYDDALFFTWEEYDFALRAIARGWRIVHRGDLAVRHAAAAERRVAWSDRRWFYSVRNRLLIARKWGASWPALAPRCAAYLLRGALHGGLIQSARGIAAAAALSRTIVPARLGPAARAYLARTDAAPRGHPLRRLWVEAVRASQPARSRPSRARSSSAKTGGLSIR